MRGFSQIEMMKSDWKYYFFVLLAAIFFVSTKVGLQESRYPAFDEYRYLYVAKSIANLNNFSDLFRPGVTSKETMAEMPLTPLYLAGLLRVDLTFDHSITCILEKHGYPKPDVRQCPNDYGFFIVIQVLLAAVSASLLWLIARNLSASRQASSIALLLGLASGQYDASVRTFLTEGLMVLFLSVFFLGLSLAFGPDFKKNNRHSGLIITGIGLGFCALNRQGYAFLAYAVLMAVLFTYPIARARHSISRWYFLSGLLPFSILAISIIVIVLPWLLRNVWLFSTWALTDGHDAHVIVERISYNAMSSKEWLAAWFFWLPDFGDKLGPALFGDDAVRRLRWDGSNSFYQFGNGPLQAIMRAEAEDAGAARLTYAIKNYVFGDILKHSMVSLVLSWRGLWLGGYFGLITQFLAAVGVGMLLRDRRYGTVLILGLPALFIVGFHGFVSVSIPRYNVVMLPYLCTLSALMLENVAKRIWSGYKLR